MIFRNSVILDGIQYDYEVASWLWVTPIKSSRNTTQGRPSFQYDGLDQGNHKIQLTLLTGSVSWGASTSGESQLNSLRTTLNKAGSSVPIIFVSPVGVTHLVVPESPLSVNLQRTFGSSTTPINFIADLSLWEV